MWPSSGWYILLGRSTQTERCFCRKSSGMCGQGIRWNQVNFILRVSFLLVASPSPTLPLRGRECSFLLILPRRGRVGWGKATGAALASFELRFALFEEGLDAL